MLAAALQDVWCVERVFESAANFLLVRLKNGVDAEALCRKILKDHSIYLKNVSSKFPDGKSYLRLAVRSSVDNANLLKALDRLGGAG